MQRWRAPTNASSHWHPPVRGRPQLHHQRAGASLLQYGPLLLQAPALPDSAPACVQEVEDKFSKYGDVRGARIVRNTYNGESRGFGFVEMKTEEGTDRVCTCSVAVGLSKVSWMCTILLMSLILLLQAIRALDGGEWNGRRLLVERARNVRTDI